MEMDRSRPGTGGAQELNEKQMLLNPLLAAACREHAQNWGQTNESAFDDLTEGFRAIVTKFGSKPILDALIEGQSRANSRVNSSITLNVLLARVGELADVIDPDDVIKRLDCHFEKCAEYIHCFPAVQQNKIADIAIERQQLTPLSYICQNIDRTQLPPDVFAGQIKDLKSSSGGDIGIRVLSENWDRFTGMDPKVQAECVDSFISTGKLDFLKKSVLPGGPEDHRNFAAGLAKADKGGELIRYKDKFNLSDNEILSIVLTTYPEGKEANLNGIFGGFYKHKLTAFSNIDKNNTEILIQKMPELILSLPYDEQQRVFSESTNQELFSPQTEQATATALVTNLIAKAFTMEHPRLTLVGRRPLLECSEIFPRLSRADVLDKYLTAFEECVKNSKGETEVEDNLHPSVLRERDKNEHEETILELAVRIAFNNPGEEEKIVLRRALTILKEHAPAKFNTRDRASVAGVIEGRTPSVDGSKLYW